MKKVFIDGSAGTTGLRIYERLSAREDIEILSLTEEKRKDRDARKEMLNKADVAFLCLPDDAARESVSLVDNSKRERKCSTWRISYFCAYPTTRQEKRFR